MFRLQQTLGAAAGHLPENILLRSHTPDHVPTVLFVGQITGLLHSAEELAEHFRILHVLEEQAALAELEKGAVDLLVCDWSLTESPTTPLMQHVLARDEFDRIPLLVSLDEATAEKIPLDHIGQDYLLAPVRPAEFIFRAKKILMLKQSIAQLAAEARERSVQYQQSENRFRLMVESIEDYAMFMVSLSGDIISWNRGAERLTGYTESEAIGQHFSMLYPRKALDECHALHELAMAAEQGRYEEEGMRVRKDGTTYLAQVTIWRVDDNQGRPIGFAKITRDITARKLAQEREAKLLESETRFRLMVESIQDYAMFMVDLQGCITSWNRGAERLTGYKEPEVIGRHFSLLFSPEELSAEHALYELAMARNKGRYEEEGVRVRKDGSTYYAQILVWPMQNHRGEIVGFAKITRDITARRQAEQALRESEAKFRTITEAMPQMVWSTLPNGDHDYFNRQWYNFTGATVGSTYGAGWNRMLHPDDQERARAVWQHSLQTGETYEIQYRLRHHSGTYRWTLGRALPVRNDQGQIVRWMGTLTDIHEQKEAEESLKDADRRKDEFLAMLAHELRNPLAPVRNSTFLLGKLLNHPDERITQAINVIERQVRHMTLLIDDLLDVARISRGKIEIRRESVNLMDVVRHTVEDFSADYQSKGVELRVIADSEPLWIRGDRTRLSQVIGNLLHNALKFTEGSGEVTITVRGEWSAGKGVATVDVADSGSGIAPEIAAHLFNPFTQANQGLARSKGGLGLGLALVKGFVELHGGSVNAHSQGEGRGAVFSVRLPLSQFVQENTQTENAGTDVRPLRVLLIEDNPDMLQTLGTILRLDGHEVFSASDGVSGLKLIREKTPDLVLCDIGLPGGCSGYDVAREVRTDGEIADTFLVVLSGYGQEQDRRRARESGFDRHLLKPLDFGELAKVLADVKPR